MSETVKLKRADYPEQVGVSSRKLNILLDNLKNTNYHGMMVIRHGIVASEWYRSPVGNDTVHAMYSVSKSITALAIGFAVNEGLVSTDDDMLKFFPEYKDKIKDENIKKIKIHHLLSMTAGRKIGVLADKERKDWIDLFMYSKFGFVPGDSFEYVNENFFILSCIIKRVTGLNMTDYLKPRLFEPLGIENTFWETDRNGIEAGGWGMFMTIESLAKIFYCFSNKGVFNGKQVISSDWIERSIKNYKGPHSPVRLDQGAAYGYGVWRRKNPEGSYRFDGVFTQFSEYFEEYDAIVVMIGGDPSFDAHTCVYNMIDELFIEPGEKDVEGNKLLDENKQTISFSPLSEKSRSSLEKSINKKNFVFKKKFLINRLGFPVSVLTYPATYMGRNRAGNINNVSFEFKEKSLIFSWEEKEEKNSIECGMDGEYRISDMKLAEKNYHTYSSAHWEDNNTLAVEVHPLESVGIRTLHFKFNGKRVKLETTSVPTLNAVLGSLKRIFRKIFKTNERSEKVIQIIIKILEPVHHGKMK